MAVHELSGSRLSPQTADDDLRIAKWAENLGVDGRQLLAISLSKRPTPMAHSNATGAALVSNGFLGVDLIRIRAGDSFVPHTHPGDHLLIVIGGEGTITFNGKIFPSYAGEVYMVEGAVPHAVGAITDHVILAVGAPHKALDSEERMTPVDYAAVAANIETLHCLICGIQARCPQRIHDRGCPHCPCAECNPHP